MALSGGSRFGGMGGGMGTLWNQQRSIRYLREGKPELAHDLYVQAEGQSEESPEADIGQVRADLLSGEFRRASAFAAALGIAREK